MSIVEALRKKLTVAATYAAATAVPMAGCAVEAVGGQGKPHSDGLRGSQLLSSDLSAELCETWLKGRSNRWCASPEQAREYATAGVEEMGCPTTLNPKKIGREQAFKRSNPTARGRVVLLGANAATASSDCGKATCCYLWVTDQYRRHRPRIVPGRPLISAGTGEYMTASVLSQGGPWLIPLGLELGRFEPSVVKLAADHWLEAARYEHASIGSFARAAAELRLAGAPQELVEGCRQAAVDEARHAALCFSVVSELRGGAAVGPGALPHVGPREVGLGELAVNVFMEGCVAESTAALEASQAAGRAFLPTLAAVLYEIAEDEAGHAALAWKTVAWALATGGDEVRGALRQAAARHERELNRGGHKPAPTSPSRAVGELGCTTAQARLDVARQAWHGIIAPLAAKLTS